MKTEDYNKLKELCEANGFELMNESVNDNDKWFLVKKKDIWDGVEFINRKTTEWPICKISRIDNEIIYYYNSEFSDVHWNKKDLLPATEQAYIEQLKKQAFEKGIKSNTNIDTSMMYGGDIMHINEWQYRKDTDTLYFLGKPIYQQGKWATKLPERIEVEYTDDSWDDFEDYSEIGFVFKLPKLYDIKRGAGDFLAKQLEEYLNS